MITCYSFNGSNYDNHYLIKSLIKSNKEQYNVIGTNTCLKMIGYGPIKFIDFMM